MGTRKSLKCMNVAGFFLDKLHIIAICNYNGTFASHYASQVENFVEHIVINYTM